MTGPKAGGNLELNVVMLFHEPPASLRHWSLQNSKATRWLPGGLKLLAIHIALFCEALHRKGLRRSGRELGSQNTADQRDNRCNDGVDDQAHGACAQGLPHRHNRAFLHVQRVPMNEIR